MLRLVADHSLIALLYVFTSEAKKPRRLLDLQETILQQSVSSNSTLTGGDNDSTKQLAVKFSLAVFAAASSYLSVSPSVDFSSIKTVTSLFKYSDVLCAAGQYRNQ